MSNGNSQTLSTLLLRPGIALAVALRQQGLIHTVHQAVPQSEGDAAAGDAAAAGHRRIMMNDRQQHGQKGKLSQQPCLQNSQLAALQLLVAQRLQSALEFANTALGPTYSRSAIKWLRLGTR